MISKCVAHAYRTGHDNVSRYEARIGVGGAVHRERCPNMYLSNEVTRFPAHRTSPAITFAAHMYRLIYRLSRHAPFSVLDNHTVIRRGSS